jgi:hypothetical protein
LIGHALFVRLCGLEDVIGVTAVTIAEASSKTDKTEQNLRL